MGASQRRIMGNNSSSATTFDSGVDKNAKKEGIMSEANVKSERKLQDQDRVGNQRLNANCPVVFRCNKGTSSTGKAAADDTDCINNMRNAIDRYNNHTTSINTDDQKFLDDYYGVGSSAF